MSDGASKKPVSSMAYESIWNAIIEIGGSVDSVRAPSVVSCTPALPGVGRGFAGPAFSETRVSWSPS